MSDLLQELRENPYPGRGILIGRSPDGKKAAIAYFIMGRSVNSRNRVFVTEGDGIRTKAHDPALLKDPSLVIYAPVRVVKGITVVTNGDQTDTVADRLQALSGETVGYGDAQTAFIQALMTRTFEPDPPNYTPRISGFLSAARGELRYSLSILKSAGGNPDSARRYFYDYETPLPGEGHFIHTYAYDTEGDALKSFDREPTDVDMGAICEGLDGESGIEAFTQALWGALNPDNRVSLFTRTIDIVSGETLSRIVNKNDQEVSQ